LTQNELAAQSGIPLRTIQQYEQRQKDINKAQAEYLILLSKALHCPLEELIEKV
jgi:transcriptional regulator with XRE-family HTH domain